MLGTIISKIQEYRYKKFISSLIQRGLRIGKNSYILEGAFLDPSHCFLISIGNNCTLAPNVRLIAHDASMKNFLGFTKIGRIKIHDNCFLGDSVMVLPGVSIGPNAIIGAGSVVTHDIPPNSVVVGNPARVIISLDEFMKKHEENYKKNKYFSKERFKITVISDKDKENMVEYLEDQIGYIE